MIYYNEVGVDVGDVTRSWYFANVITQMLFNVNVCLYILNVTNTNIGKCMRKTLNLSIGKGKG